MRKYVVKIGLLSIILCAAACNSTQNTSAENTTANTPELGVADLEVSVNNLKDNLEYLASDELKGRNTGSPGIEKAADFIENKLREYNVEPFFKTYRDTFSTSGRTAYNIVGVIPGKDLELKQQYILIGAHYDHIGIQKPVDNDSIANGADDNAAGTVSVLELSRKFSQINQNKRSIIFALFSGEELGLKGSAHLAEKLKSQGIDLYAMVNLEMVGVPMKDKDYLAYLTGFNLSNMAEVFNKYADKKVLGFLPQAAQYNLFRRSDNYSFYEQFHVPAQTLSSFDFTNYEYYHKVQDEAAKMDFEFMASLVKQLIPGLYKMANSPQKEIKLTEG
ncbi:MAG: M20/M25/M40 family metallo-hydrolase [Gillisia sp.]